MSKALVSIGYVDYVLDIGDAVTLMGIMGKAELYKAVTDYNAKPNTTAYYVWEQDPTRKANVVVQLLPDAVYRVAKMAGKPQE
jgi:hypothetical protein